MTPLSEPAHTSLVTTGTPPRSRRRGWLLAVALFLFSPYVGEFVLGNQPITAFPSLLLLAPMYGGGALLIREVVRRTSGGWPMIILLAAAYALFEEGVVDQMLFNPGYLGLDSFAGYGLIPGLGMSASLTQGSLMLHTVWSISVPIAVIEAFDDDRTRPWIGRVGMVITASVFVIGCVSLALMQYAQFRFVAKPVQFGVVGVAIVALVAAALLIGFRRPADTPSRGRPAPGAVSVAVVAFVVSSGYWLIELIVAWIASDWVVIGCWAVFISGCVVLLARFARRPGWGRTHVFAIAAGTLLTYVWHGFAQSAYLPVPRPVGVLGNVVFGAGAIVVVALAARAERRRAVALHEATQRAIA